MKTIYSFLTIIAAIILSACSKSESFSVGGVIEGAGMQTVNMTYYAAGGIKRVSQTAVEDGLPCAAIPLLPHSA